LGAFFALRAKNRAFRSKSSDLPLQSLWAFRSNPLRSGRSVPGQEIAAGNFLGAQLPLAIVHIQPGGRNFGTKLRGLPPSAERSAVHVAITTGCRAQRAKLLRNFAASPLRSGSSSLNMELPETRIV
jgi:hypothetical protein